MPLQKGSRIISAFQPCSVGNPNRFGIDEYLIDNGWQKWIEKNISPEVEWLAESGGIRFLVHNPFCARKGEVYQFDQYIHAQNAGVITTKGFFEAWRPVVALGEVIFYMGMINNDLDFQKRKEVGKLDNYMQRVLDSVRPILDVGGSIAFDAANNLPSGSVEYETLDSIRAMCSQYGARAYIEPAPEKSFPNLHDWNSITTESLWVNRQPTWLDESLLTGELIRWVTHPEGGNWGGSATDLASRFVIPMKRVLADGHSVCGPTVLLRAGGFSVDDILE